MKKRENSLYRKEKNERARDEKYVSESFLRASHPVARKNKNRIFYGNIRRKRAE
jgi:hypothetical protein